MTKYRRDTKPQERTLAPRPRPLSIPAVVAICLLLFAVEHAAAQFHRAARKNIRRFQSEHVTTYTDLDDSDAEQLVERLEKTLRYAARYWGRKPRGRIECYVVKDLDGWPDAALPHRLARILVDRVGGATLADRQKSSRGTTVYASSRRGVAEHEIVHAYCAQAFGKTGPDWYKEGMAELAAQASGSEGRPQLSDRQLELLRNSRGRSIRKVLAGGKFNRRIFDSLSRKLTARENRHGHIPTSDWTSQDSRNVRRARKENLQNWALCYMLSHNSNYARRFRALGNGFLTDRQQSFEDLFTAVRRQVAFEYEFLLRRIQSGYRVDLCRWEWDKAFQTLDESSYLDVQVKASRGYQASGLTVEADQKFAYRTKGHWKTSPKASATSADGASGGDGQLMGVIFSDFELSEPFPLGARGTFVAPRSGKLYLRCRDAWNELSDNEGSVLVRFAMSERP